jgi:hypothetical protein
VILDFYSIMCMDGKIDEKRQGKVGIEGKIAWQLE